MKLPFIPGSALLGLGLLCGCANYTIQPISSAALERDWPAGKAHKGYIIYQPELYFLVTHAATSTTNPAGGVSGQYNVTPLYLPNPAKPYRVTSYNFLAKSDFEFTFTDGWKLLSLADKGDNSTVANTLAGEAAAIISKTVPTLLPTQGANTNTFLLHPDYDAQGIITNFSIASAPTLH